MSARMRCSIALRASVSPVASLIMLAGIYAARQNRGPASAMQHARSAKRGPSMLHRARDRAYMIASSTLRRSVTSIAAG
jgi:hypothetical protein